MKFEKFARIAAMTGCLISKNITNIVGRFSTTVIGLQEEKESNCSQIILLVQKCVADVNETQKIHAYIESTNTKSKAIILSLTKLR